MNLDNRTTTTTYLALLVFCLMISACGGDKPTTSLADGGPVPGMDSGPNVCTLNCDDGVECTDDLLNEAACTCGHLPLHARCSVGQICDLQDGCVEAPPCAEDEDCPEPDDFCIVATCNQAVAACQYDPLDKDKDGHPPQNCASVAGDDCDDTKPGFYKYCDVDQPCTPSENDYDCISCQMGALTYPGATELCDYKDNDCNGTADDNPMIGTPCDSEWDNDLCEEGVWDCLYDLDREEFDSLRCTDDTGSNQEICDELDNDCDGEVDEEVDQDSDDFFATCGGGPDCDDTDPSVNPWAWEACDDLDNNCNSSIDEDWPELGLPCDGADQDFCAEGIWVCDSNGWDVHCTDTTGTATEICNGLDDDCDGQMDEGVLITSYQDADGDGYGNSVTATTGCSVPADRVTQGGDCNDSNADISPGTPELCDGQDNNCNWTVDDGLGGSTCDPGEPSACPDGVQIECNCCDGLDNDIDILSDASDTDCANSWCSTSTSGAPYRLNYSTMWTGMDMIIWGGRAGEIALNTGLRYNPASDTWTDVSQFNAPEARYYHTAIWTGTEMIVWGGLGETDQPLANGRRYNPDTNNWSSMTSQGAPSARYTHLTVWTGTEMVILGGFWTSNGGFSASSLYDGGRYNPSTNTWTSIDSLPTGSSDSAFWTGTHILVWGVHQDGYYWVNAGGRYDPVEDSWLPIQINGAPPAKPGNKTLWTGDTMCVWNGDENNAYITAFESGSCYSPITDSWTLLTATEQPSPRRGASLIWTSEIMILWGGRQYDEYGNDSGPTNTGAWYDPLVGTWVTLPTLNAPVSRWAHIAVWDGLEMIIWGGCMNDYCGTIYNTGGRYFPPQ